MDFYLSDYNTINRLVAEWERYGQLVIAYDFDNTVFDYHGQGHSYAMVTELLRDCKEIGAHLMVYTAREDNELEFVEDYLKANDIPYDSINESPPYIKFSGRKLYYNILLDDRAGLASAYHSLTRACVLMKAKKAEEAKQKIGRYTI